MAKQLSAISEDQLDRLDIRKIFSCTIDSVERSTDIIAYNVSYDRDYGTARLVIDLNNDAGVYSADGAREVKLGDEVILREKFQGGSYFSVFTGYVRQRGINKSSGVNAITLTCMDYIVKLMETTINQTFEASKNEVTNEGLTPTYLGSPNQMLAQTFAFANNNLADKPLITITVVDKNTLKQDPRFDGFEINYEDGTCTLGMAINALDNYYIRSTYSYYPTGLYIEDIIEDIIEAKDGYGNYLFGETTLAGLQTHYTETLSNVEGSATDTMYPNVYEEKDVEIRTFATIPISAGMTTLPVNSTAGFPTHGSATVCGDTFTWTSKTATTLDGIPATGANRLEAHSGVPVVSWIIYTTDYAAGKLWYTTWNNVTTSLDSGDFTIGGGGTFATWDARYGRLILSSAIATSSVVTCDTDYSYKTIQSTGIEINKIKFNQQKTANRFEAIKELKKYLPPNYLMRTQGTDKIWATYINQKITADFTLKAMQNLDYGEDQDIYTRTFFYGKNQNPVNLIFDNNVSLVYTSYTDTATDSELTYVGDTWDGGKRIYSMSAMNCPRIKVNNFMWKVYIDGIPVDSYPYKVSNNQCTVVKVDTDGVAEYKVYFGRNHIYGIINDTTPIKLYDDVGNLLYTINSYTYGGQINVSEGYWKPPSTANNIVIERISAADFWISYGGYGGISINSTGCGDQFLINKGMLPEPEKQKVTATFEYYTAESGHIHGGDYGTEIMPDCFDGNYNTQTQSIFSTKPIAGAVWAIIDLGQVRTIHGMDILAGFFIPWDNPDRKIDYTNHYTIQYSTDGVTYYDIAPGTNNFSMSAGDNISWGEDIFGEEFLARYFKIIMEDLSEISYHNLSIYGYRIDKRWALSFVQISIYRDIRVAGSCKLIATTQLSSATTAGDATVNVLDTSGFTTTGSGRIDDGEGNLDHFAYTGITATTFTGCSGVGTNAIDLYVYQQAEAVNWLYDKDFLLPKLGDIVYVDTTVYEHLDTWPKVYLRAKDFLKEFYKNHSKVNINVLYAPHIRMGHTVAVTDVTNNISKNYFVESVSYSDSGVGLTLAYYP